MVAGQLAGLSTWLDGDLLEKFLKSKPADLTIESAVSTGVQVQIYGSTAIVTGLDTISGKNKGEPYTNRWLYMDVWVKRSGRWQCVKTYSSLANKK